MLRRTPFLLTICAVGFLLQVSALFTFRFYSVASRSMEPTYKIGDLAIVIRQPMSGTPLDGDVITILSPDDQQSIFIKRVLGVAGDRLHFDNKQLYRNGKKLDEPYVQHASTLVDQYRDHFPRDLDYDHMAPKAKRMLEENVKNGELVVPEGYLFVLGDNRDNSLDSRYWGSLQRENVMGHVVFKIAK